MLATTICSADPSVLVPTRQLHSSLLVQQHIRQQHDNLCKGPSRPIKQLDSCGIQTKHVPLALCKAATEMVCTEFALKWLRNTEKGSAIALLTCVTAVQKLLPSSLWHQL